ncbi:Tsr1-like ribosome biogenesis protein [Encephalitozoon hellem]|uniref:Tsr1-like ribosome biogenesis protein n=1 Tax=Encephalitozoon hellem TaxID=27973 RepID=A0ABY8CMA5_ENCHE|nr:Tsr1-like ribosome biogenesis protein [Encephalitozoon hellem]
MKAKDRRNRTKMKSIDSITKIKESKAIYSLRHGPYMVVSIVSLGRDCGNYFDKYLHGEGGLFFSEEHKMNFLFKQTDELNGLQLGYVCRASDVVVFFIDSDEVDDDKLKIIKKFVPSCIFCIANQGLKDVAKRLTKKHFPKERIVEIEGLIGALSNVRVKNTSVCRRPYIVPSNVYCDGEYFYVEGFLKRGFLSDKVIVNGRYEMSIEEVVGDKIYKGCDLRVSIDIGGTLNTDIEKPEEECDSESLMSACSDHDMKENDSDDEYSIEDESSAEDRPSLIDKYSEYRGIRNLSTCSFRSCSFPEHYKGLVFFDDFKRAEKLIAGQDSIIPSNQMVKIKLRYEGLLEERICVLFGCYEYEDQKTIHNFHFEGQEPLKEESMVVDLGHKIVNIRPMITRNLNHKVFKRQEELESGVISFIGPVTLGLSRVLIYRKSILGELCASTLVSVGMNGFMGDRIIFEEAVFQGIPFRNKKRYSLVKRMFNSKEEVMYFRNIQLYMRNKKITGFIKKPIGTKGTFKGYFTQPIKSGDKVMMSLYKRVFLEDQ